jgi:hypothetical protein
MNKMDRLLKNIKSTLITPVLVFSHRFVREKANFPKDFQILRSQILTDIILDESSELPPKATNPRWTQTGTANSLWRGSTTNANGPQWSPSKTHTHYAPRRTSNANTNKSHFSTARTNHPCGSFATETIE